MKLFLTSVLSVVLILGCRQGRNEMIKISGEAQGTTYHISYYDNDNRNFNVEVDSIFRKIDSSLSTYLPVSIISKINKNKENVELDNHFINVFKKSMEVSQLTNGAFDITVAPVINAWGFGFSKKEKVDSTMIDSLLQLVGYNKVKLQDAVLLKEKPGVMLDFNAIAQGYTVDVMASFFESNNVENYFIEIGGEVRAKGNKKNKEEWKLGIDQPLEDNTAERTLEAIINLNNMSLATSGNYRKFYVENGRKYSHIIDPKTGYPAKNNLLSASVAARDCMTADAYATAFMVMGMEKSKQFLAANKDLQLEVFFIYDDNREWKTFASENLKKWIEELR